MKKKYKKNHRLTKKIKKNYKNKKSQKVTFFFKYLKCLKIYFFFSKKIIQRNPLRSSILGIHDSIRALQSSSILRKSMEILNFFQKIIFFKKKSKKL